MTYLGIDRVFKHIGFYAVGCWYSGKKRVKAVKKGKSGSRNSMIVPLALIFLIMLSFNYWNHVVRILIVLLL